MWIQKSVHIGNGWIAMFGWMDCSRALEYDSYWLCWPPHKVYTYPGNRCRMYNIITLSFSKKEIIIIFTKNNTELYWDCMCWVTADLKQSHLFHIKSFAWAKPQFLILQPLAYNHAFYYTRHTKSFGFKIVVLLLGMQRYSFPTVRYASRFLGHGTVSIS